MNIISAEELRMKIINNEELLLIDVRETFERTQYHIGGVHIPMNSIFENINIIPKDKSVVIYCQKGIRSQIVIQRLTERFGYDNLVNLSGGMEAWKKLTQTNES
jgi:adenylyltransferase/sulfurtransferase